MLNPLGQYALTGTAQPIARLMAAMAACSREGAPYALTRADIVNAFGSAGQPALLSAIRRLGLVAPEMAALSLRAQCSTRDRGSVELVLRGDCEVGERERYTVHRYARGGAQGPPDMPAAFAMVMAEVDEDAAARAGDGLPETDDAAADELWGLYQRVAPDLPDTPAPAWTEALRELLREPRPRAACVTTLYAETTPTAPATSTSQSAVPFGASCARERLAEAPHKCGLLTAPRWRAPMETLIAPLRGGDARAWPLQDAMKVLGVTLTDPGDPDNVRTTVTESLAATVVDPVRRLADEVRGGERKATALFLLHRYILPVLAYHQGAWGLLAPAGVWGDVDAALDGLAEALCPEDLRGRLARGSPLRRELALPKGKGGLGIPDAASETPLKAAALWPRQQALAAGAPGDLVRVAYYKDVDVFHQTAWKPRTTEAHHKAIADGLWAVARGQERRRLAQNKLRAPPLSQ